MDSITKLMSKYDEDLSSTIGDCDLSSLTDQQVKFIKELIELQDRNKGKIKIYLNKENNISISVNGDVDKLDLPDSFLILAEKVGNYCPHNEYSLFYNFKYVNDIDILKSKVSDDGVESDINSIIRYYNKKMVLVKELVDDNKGNVYAYFDATYPFEVHIAYTIQWSKLNTNHEFGYYFDNMHIIGTNDRCYSVAIEHDTYLRCLSNSFTKTIGDYGDLIVERYDDSFFNPIKYASNKIKDEYIDSTLKQGKILDNNQRELVKKELKNEYKKIKKDTKRIARLRKLSNNAKKCIAGITLLAALAPVPFLVKTSKYHDTIVTTMNSDGVEKNEEILQMYEEGKAIFIDMVSIMKESTKEANGIISDVSKRVHSELKVYLPYEKNIDGSYSRNVITYDISKLEEDKVKDFFTNYDYFIENYSNILGEPISIDSVTRDNITEEELNKGISAEAKILSEGKEKEVTYFDYIILVLMGLLATAAYHIADLAIDGYSLQRRIEYIYFKYNTTLDMRNMLEIIKAELNLLKNHPNRNITNRQMTLDEIEKLAIVKQPNISREELIKTVQKELLYKPIKE